MTRKVTSSSGFSLAFIAYSQRKCVLSSDCSICKLSAGYGKRTLMSNVIGIDQNNQINASSTPKRECLWEESFLEWVKSTIMKKIISEIFTTWFGCEVRKWVRGHKWDAFASSAPVNAKSSNGFGYRRQVLNLSTAYECPPLNPQLLSDKIAFVRPHHLPKLWGKKPKATTKVTLRATNNKYPPITVCQS